jgi:hypothetical protein
MPPHNDVGPLRALVTHVPEKRSPLRMNLRFVPKVAKSAEQMGLICSTPVLRTSRYSPQRRRLSITNSTQTSAWAVPLTGTAWSNV